jgi:hypothetical protein
VTVLATTPTTTTQPDGQAPPANTAPPATQPASTSNDSATPDRLKVLESELKEARAEAAKYRKRNDDETAQRLKEQGDYKALYEKATPDLEKAKRYDAWAEKQRARIDAEKASLPTAMQKVLAVASIEDAIEILDAFKADQVKATTTTITTPPASTTTTAKPPATPPPNGAPPGSPPPDVDLTALSVQEIDALERDHPERFKAALQKIGPKAPPTPSTAWTQAKRPT